MSNGALQLAILGDGSRDEAMLPGIVAAHFPHVEFELVRFMAWQNLRVRGGYAGKLSYFVRQLQRDAEVDPSAVVAVLDQDKDRPRSRLQRLAEARERDRAQGWSFVVAIGEARPHGEAWLLDDDAAVKRVLQLGGEAKVPAVGKNPKADLQALIDASDRADVGGYALFQELGAALRLKSCRKAKETGFSEFVSDVETEFAPLRQSRA